MKRKFLIAFFLSCVSFASHAVLPTPDLVGVIQFVRVLSSSNGVNYFQVYFKSVENNRYGCIDGNNSIVVSTDSDLVNTTQFNQIFTIALSAQVQGKRVALDTGNDCKPHTAWMLD